MTYNYDIVIIGGGLAGAGLACALAGEDLTIALVEARPVRGAHPHGVHPHDTRPHDTRPHDTHPHSDDARGIALALSSQKILDEMGLWRQLEPLAGAVEQVHVSARGRLGCVRLAADMLDLEALGYVVPAPELGRVLFEELGARANIDLLCPAAAGAVQYNPDSISVQVRQAGAETALRCRLLVIADGARSSLREAVGIQTRTHDYRQTAIVANVTVAREHRNTAYERVIPGGLIALLPLPGGRRCVTVLVAPTDAAARDLQLDDDGYLRLLQQTFGKRLGAFSEAGPRQSWPLFLLQPERQVAARVALLGNAAHTIHPNGAQGLNLALRDTATLAGLVRETLRNGGDVGAPALLDSYASSRQADQRQIVLCTDALQKTSATTHPLRAALRGGAMLALDTLPGFKQAFIRRATGLHFPGAQFSGLELHGTGSQAADRKAATARGWQRQAQQTASTGPEVRSGRRTAAPSHTVPSGEPLSRSSLSQPSSSRPPDTELLIIGGGVIGSVMALLAAARGMDCILVERNVQPTTAAAPAQDARPQDAQAQDARALALTPASRQILDTVQVWPLLAEQDIGCFRQMQVWDANGAGELYFDSAAIGLPTLGHIVVQSVLVQALEAVRATPPGISIHAGAEPVGLSDVGNAVRVALSDGRQVSAKLLVAADGTRSQVRRLAGIEYPMHSYRQTAVAGVVQTELQHAQVARQRFLTNGPLAFLPMADPNRCGVVWSTAPDHAQELLAMDAATFQRALGEAFEHTLGAISRVDLRQSFPLQRAQAQRYCSARIALVGDAAHCVHPLAGMGANLGLLDVAALCQVIGAARAAGRDPGGSVALRKYERWRKGENLMVMMTLEGLKYLFENQTLPVPQLRNTGMKLYNSLPALKNLTMRRAMGMAGDLPDLQC